MSSLHSCTTAGAPPLPTSIYEPLAAWAVTYLGDLRASDDDRDDDAPGPVEGLMVYARRLMSRFREDGPWIRRWLPLTSSAVMTLLGLGIAVQAVLPWLPR